MTNYVQKISDIVNYIEVNIKNDISLDTLTELSGLSKYHMHRIFKELTNKGIMEYVRARKLTNSLEYLLNSNLRIIDIAIMFGYLHEQSYIRCFKKQFRITPARYRREKCELSIESILDTSLMHSFSDQIIIEPKIVLKNEFTLVGSENRIYASDDRENSTANKVGNLFYTEYKDKFETSVDTNTYYGLVKYFRGDMEYNIYVPSFEVNDKNIIPEGLTINKIPKHTYAVFKYIGIHSPYLITITKLIDLLDYITKTWGSNTIHNWTTMFHFEKINNNICNDNYCELELYFPLLD